MGASQQRLRLRRNASHATARKVQRYETVFCDADGKHGALAQARGRCGDWDNRATTAKRRASRRASRSAGRCRAASMAGMAKRGATVRKLTRQHDKSGWRGVNCAEVPGKRVTRAEIPQPRQALT